MEMLFFGTVVVAVVIILYQSTGRWAGAFRQYMYDQSEKVFGYGFGWDKPRGLLLSKAMVIFFGFMFIVVVYSFFFTPTP